MPETVVSLTSHLGEMADPDDAAIQEAILMSLISPVPGPQFEDGMFGLEVSKFKVFRCRQKKPASPRTIHPHEPVRRQDPEGLGFGRAEVC